MRREVWKEAASFSDMKDFESETSVRVLSTQTSALHFEKRGKHLCAFANSFSDRISAQEESKVAHEALPQHEDGRFSPRPRQ